MSQLPGKQRPYQDHLRYKHMVARLKDRPFYEIENAVLAELAKGKRWRIDAALEALAQNPDRYNYMNYPGIFETAARFGRLTAMHRLTAIYKSEKMSPDSDRGRSHGIVEAFDMAALHGHYRVADFLKQFGGTPDTMLRDNRHPRAMSFAIMHNDVKKIDYLLNAGADAAYYLGRAISSRNLSVVARLLDAGADTNFKAQGHWTPLHLAARLGDISMVELLVERGADVKLCANDLLYDLVAGDRFAVFERMVELGAKPDTRDLEHAVAEGKIPHVKLMLSKGLQLKPEMLVHALGHHKSNPAMIELCLNNGVNPQDAHRWLASNTDSYKHSAPGTRDKIFAKLETLSANGNTPRAAKPPKHG